MADGQHGIGEMVRELASRWKGALTGLAVFILLWLGVFICAFMIAFGNETSWSGTAMRVIELFFTIANPLWGIPVSVILGAACYRHDVKD